ncbi:hypothetical protein EHS13_22600 [Paenibacillus psychroresistens]|jgi:hypothetical protein|uniref:Uncharacterized protein n=1 Tax=Paenibacillus psychroresistens TaxID=1778678 RepID=A0A6B8RPJ4_9BACL|nr:hypothetical protein [Paenibacillus psychroresistens]QGQ97475.1 hypothetical protein EHS13_22600 [Paenibacillus psychroresistens]
MAINFSQIKNGDLLQVQPLDKNVKLFMERQGYTVGSTVQVIEVSEPIPSFNPRTGTDEIYLHITVTNGNRPLGFDVRESEGYVSEYFS